ncbi:hypothetical protein BSL82_09615 [Tardibacter chloracetimidivorans]|uniref:Uncharacterized protein n=1 Tax=Tardibacter chloracetimidivorans TaxID=1921510 RepID=A0A1L3ZV88_9SPHN|nr:hypothetical protein [Tardibacter chloracetimidivorans]API59538.1 hypothetical protein BSL82_09615 [Tardibacter chloracetimidivorans]
MSGYVAMSREWLEHDIFDGDVFSRRDAWAWLIASAAWRQTKARIKGHSVDLERGELSYSVRFMAEKWGWSKSAVDRFLKLLTREGMISMRSKTGTTAGHPAGQGQSIITICNYAKYQTAEVAKRDNEETETGTTAGQQRDKELTIKPLNQENINIPDYEFGGKVIRLNLENYRAWEKAYPNLDLRAALQSRDDWLATEAPEATRKNWFVPTSNWLANLNRKHRQPSQSDEQVSVPC